MDKKQIEAAAHAAVKWWGERLASGDREKFEATLLPLVRADLEKHGVCRTECDYDPFGHLLTAVRAAGVQCAGMMFSARGILPQKHELEIYPDRLEPKEGYGNWTEAIPVTTEPASA